MKKLIFIASLLLVLSLNSCIRVYTSEVKEEPKKVLTEEETKVAEEQKAIGILIVAYPILLIMALAGFSKSSSYRNGVGY